MNKKIIILVMCLFLPFSVNAKTLADMRKELKNLQTKLENSKKEEKLNQDEVNRINNEINDITKTIEETQVEIEKSNKKIEINEMEIEKKRDETDNLIKYFQISSSENVYLEYLFESKTYTEFIYRYAVVKQLTEYNDNLSKELKGLITELENTKVELKEKEETLKNTKSSYEDKLLMLALRSSELKVEGTSIEDDIEYLKEEIKTYEDMGCLENQDIRICKAVPNSKGWTYPLLSGWVTSNYTSNRSPVYSGNVIVSYGAHYGIDLGGMKEGTPAYAAAPGMVTRLVVRSNCGGNQVFVEHNVNGVVYTTVYMHLLSISVKKGDIVTTSTEIGKVGGDSTSTQTKLGKLSGGYDNCTNGTHLHFGISYGSYSSGTYGFNANSFNPTKILDFSRGYFSR